MNSEMGTIDDDDDIICMHGFYNFIRFYSICFVLLEFKFARDGIEVGL